MELVHGGAKVLGCAWLWFCFSCVDDVGAEGQKEVVEVKDKMRQLLKTKYFSSQCVYMFSFLFLGVRMVFLLRMH